MNTDLYPLRSTVPEGVPVPFSFQSNGAGAVVQATIQGKRIVASATRTGLGTFDVVLRAIADAYIGFDAYAPDAAADADYSISSVRYVAATKTITIRTRTAGAAADPAAGVQIGGTIWFRNTNQVY